MNVCTKHEGWVKVPGGMAVIPCKCSQCHGKRERNWINNRKPQLEALQKKWNAAVSREKVGLLNG